jgi:hypothetical protein
MKSKILYSSLAIMLIMLYFCNDAKHIDVISQASISFIQPPVKGVDIPFEKHSFLAEKGDTFIYKSGSILLFPPDAFLDKNGNVIKGKVDIAYREFSNPLDYYISGMPMSYDSWGIHYTF